MTSPITAASTYAALSRLTGGNPSAAANLGAGASGSVNGPSFGSLVQNAMSALAEKGREADAKSMQFAAGKGDLIDVVTAVADTEVAVETVVSVRDKVIAAYEDIFKMPI